MGVAVTLEFSEWTLTKITGESVFNNLIDLQMFRCSGCTWKRKMTYSRYVLKMER